MATAAVSTSIAPALTSNSNNSRRYHGTSSAYVLPNECVPSQLLRGSMTDGMHSATEQDRLDAQAAAIVEMIGGFPCLAPIQSMKGISKAVDIGCGTGVATVQIAQMFPSATVYGLDISPVPEAAQEMAPKNVKWAVGNVLDVETPESGSHQQPDVVGRDIFAPGELDYIFGRMLFLGINDWKRYFSTAYHALRPGGVIEHQDLDWEFYRQGTSECLSDKWEWHKLVVAAAEKSGLSTHAGTGAAPLMKEVGLEIFSEQSFEFSFVPSKKSPNSQAMGRYVQAKLLPQYPELLRKMLGAQGISGSELESLTKDCLRDITAEEGVHQKYTVTVAKKPDSG